MLSLVYGDVILSSINFHRWYKTSEECREGRNDEKYGGRLTVSGVGTLEAINILIIEKYVVEGLKLPMGACQSLLAKKYLDWLKNKKCLFATRYCIITHGYVWSIFGRMQAPSDTVVAVFSCSDLYACI